MRKITYFFVFLTAVVFQSCSGPEGPPGPQGVQGPISEAEVFEVTRNLNASTNFSALVPLNPPILASDVVLTYVLWEVNNGEPIWRLMPQTVQLNEGDLLYNYDFTRFDVNIFLSSADFQLTILGPQWTQNQTFRIVLIPGFFASAKMNYADYDNVVRSLGLSETDVKKIQ
ncbi:MAG: collagen-like protein [Flavobacterium sp.]